MRMKIVGQSPDPDIDPDIDIEDLHPQEVERFKARQLERIADALEILADQMGGTDVAGSIRESLWMIADNVGS
jgi:hypothetical protein